MPKRWKSRKRGRCALVTIGQFQQTEGLFKNLDGRTKLAMFFMYVFTVLSTKPNSHGTWIALSVLLFIMFALGRVQLKWITLRLLPALPFVGLGAIGVLVGGSKEVFMQVTVKMILCIGASVWLSLTTPFTQLIDALRKLKFPNLLTIMLSFMFRYLFLLSDEAVRMSRAYQSRCPRKQNLKDAVNIGKLAGALMLRTYDRAERIYLAMLSRGFTGELKTISVQKMTLFDIASLFAFTLSIAIIFFFTR